MRLLKFKTLHGPNIFHNQPVIVMKVDLAKWTEVSSQEIHGFIEKLLSVFPGLMEHTCSPGHYGGFYERLVRGTYLAHIIEHVAIELSQLAKIPVTYGKTFYAGETGHYNIVTRFTNEEGMKLVLTSAFNIVQAMITAADFNLSVVIGKIHAVAEATKLGPSTESLWAAAQLQGIPVERVGEDSLLRMGYGRKSRFVQAAVTDRTSNIAVELVQDKALTKKFLQKYSIPVPEGLVISEPSEINSVLTELNPPLVLKPIDGHHGQGVCLNLNTLPEIEKSFQIAKIYSEKVLIEEMCPGRDYRVLLVNNKMTAAAERLPPSVTGDGKSTVAQLLSDLNSDPRRENGHSGYLTKVVVDEILLQTLQSQNLNLETIPKAQQNIILRYNANLSGGGTAKDVTDLVHPEVRLLCERISRLVGLDICGIDLIHSDISQPAKQDLKVIEVNAGPGLRMHLAPSEGRPRPVGEKIIEMIYPHAKDSRIPILSVTGTNGKTSVVRMLRKIFSNGQHGTVGMTSSDGIWIGNDKIESGDTSGPTSAATVLHDPQVDLAILELARGGLLRGGLAYDWSDVGIVTNIRADHLGQDGIEDIEDLIRIKSLIVERVRENGTVILNADDENALGLRDRKNLFKTKKNIILYSVNPWNLELIKHLNKKKDACWIQDEIIYVRHRGELLQLGSVMDLPVTMGGAAQFQISNLLAAVAGGIALEVPPEQIYMSLKNFNPITENSGRANLYKVHEGYIFLDYAHNPDGITAIGEMLSHFSGYRKTAVLGLPGDRKNDLLEKSAHAISRYFDQIILRDDYDLRGRNAGEVPRRLYDVITRSYPHIKTSIIENEDQAIEAALTHLTSEDIVVLFYDSLEQAMRKLRQFDPYPVESIRVFETRHLSQESLPKTLLAPSEMDKRI